MRLVATGLFAAAMVAVACAPHQAVAPASASSINTARYAVNLLPPVSQPEPTGPAPAVELDPAAEALDPPVQGADAHGVHPLAPSPSDKVLIDADACPAPPTVSPWGISPREVAVNRALKLPPAPDVLFVIQIRPAFFLARTLSLHHRPDGAYVVRSTTLTESPSVSGASAPATVPIVVRERFLDPKTAQLVLDLWSALAARVQIVTPVGIVGAVADGVTYHAWYRGASMTTHSPRRGSILDEAISAIERLGELVVKIPADERAELFAARQEMRDALQRTRRKEPCLQAWR